jgi:phosphocarrier protein HPr
MTQSSVSIVNELGLHLRAAARLVVIASRFPASVNISANGKTVDGKSLLGITSLLARQGSVITIIADGEGEKEVVNQIAELIKAGFVSAP